MLVVDAEMKQLGLHRTEAVTVGGGVDGTIVGQNRCRQTPGAACLIEGGHDIWSARDRKDLARHTHPREVIEEVDYLDLGVVFELKEGDVCLPRFVGELCLEAHKGALGALVGLSLDKAPAFEDPPDRRGRRRRWIGEAEVVVDRVGAGIEALIDELLAEPHDPVI